jgi:hypothetical protein
MTACASVHTEENTEHLSRNELADLCADLSLRAKFDCRWNVEERQSAIGDRQTWEISCIARRESARESYDNVCHPARLGIANDQGDEE